MKSKNEGRTMIVNELKNFVGKKVKITCIFGNVEPIFYSGVMKKVNDDSITLLDKFSKNVIISLDVIKKVEEIE
jgi:ferredoxin-fold anticodon binding domain-containing protein